MGILNAYGIDQAHFVGMSLGGMIAQIKALKYPATVSTLSLVMSSIFGPANSDLPPIDEKILAYHRSAATLNWADKSAVVSYMVGRWRLLSGTAHPFDEPAVRAIATDEVALATSLVSMFNHSLLTWDERWFGKMGEINVPTLVIHGTDDPVLHTSMASHSLEKFLAPGY